jgi:D-arabinose 1-dehydrogenase-like Zn-dependent alcohol dehydrogenase
MGLQVIAIDRGDPKLEYCRQLGAKFAFDSLDPDLLTNVEKLTAGGKISRASI